MPRLRHPTVRLLVRHQQYAGAEGRLRKEESKTLVKPTNPTYADRRASLSVRKTKSDKPSKSDGRWMIAIGLLILFTPAILGPAFISPAGAAIWMIVGIYWLWTGLKQINY